MVKYYVIFSCLLFGFSGTLAANAAQNVRAGDGMLTLPVFNPLRYRVPATPEAQKLHKQILSVSHNLKVLKAVPLDDPSIESRLKKIIQKKIIQIEGKLEVLKQDMKRRQALSKTLGKSSKSAPAMKSAPVMKSDPVIESSRRQRPATKAKKKLLDKNPAAEIRSLKKTLLEVSRKLAALERGMRPIIDKPAPALQKTNPSKGVSHPQPEKTGQFTSGIGIILPVARQYFPSAPKQVRTTVIYPGVAQPEPGYPRPVGYFPSLPQWKPQGELQDGVYLPLPKPGFKVTAVVKNGKPPLQDKKSEKKYASVEDDSATDSQWPDAAVVKAKTQCAKLFGKLNISFSEKPPLKKGHCGTPAPVLFKAFGKTHKVAITPAATINCKSAAVIAGWINDKVQPLAIKLLGAPITKIHNVASYNCRNRYGRKNGRISEHAFANALDVMGFTTQKGEKISVLDHFYAQDNKGEFLRKIHKLACKDKFGTVLGPEANAAHKNHFHLDLAKRRRSAYCE